MVAYGDRQRTSLQTSGTAVARKRQSGLIAQHPCTWLAAGIPGLEGHAGPDRTLEEPCDGRGAGLHVGAVAGSPPQILKSPQELLLSGSCASHATWPLPEALYQ